MVASNGGNDKTKEYCPPLGTDKSSQVECVFAIDKWVSSTLFYTPKEYYLKSMSLIVFKFKIIILFNH